MLHGFLGFLDWLALGGVVAAVVVAIRLARGAWSRRRPVSLGWLGVAAGLAGSALIDSGRVRPPLFDRTLVVLAGWHVPILEAVAVCAILTLGAFLARQSWHHPVARWCVLAALLAALTNPLTEAAEHRLVSNPDNYIFVASNQPHTFRTTPSRDLTRITTAQELTEDVSILLLLPALVLLAARGQSGRALIPPDCWRSAPRRRR